MISPLLANVYLHHVFDLWVRQWIRRTASGQVIAVRYADDIVLGIQYESDARRLLQRPETFAFLGFTHYCSETRGGKFTVKRRTHSQRMARKLGEIRGELNHRMHLAVKAQHRWLSAVLRGHYQYFGVTFNSPSLLAFYKCVKLAWFNTLWRRSQKRGMTWKRYVSLLTIFPLPKPRIVHQPWRGAPA